MFQASTMRGGFVVGLALLTALLSVSVLTGLSSAHAAPQGLSVAVSDSKNEVRSDSDVAYEATVHNDGTEPAKVTLVLTVPDYVTITDAPEADIADTDATWTVQIEPGKAITKKANAHINDIPAGQFRLTTLASVYENDTNQTPLIRNADANRIQGVTDPADTHRQPTNTDTSSPVTWTTWLLRILLPIAAVAIIGAAIYLWRRHKNNQPTNNTHDTNDTSTPPSATEVPTETEATRR